MKGTGTVSAARVEWQSSETKAKSLGRKWANISNIIGRYDDDKGYRGAVRIHLSIYSKVFRK